MVIEAKALRITITGNEKQMKSVATEMQSCINQLDSLGEFALEPEAKAQILVEAKKLRDVLIQGSTGEGGNANITMLKE